MTHKYHVIIVGSGLAGLAAADILSRYGLRILVVDDNAHTGGQLLRRLPHAGSGGNRFETDLLKRRGARLAERARKGNFQILQGNQVLGVYPHRTLMVADNRGRISEYCADALILATGAREKHLPFTGWTLPGVMSTGAAQILIKSSGILPGRKTLIGGCSPLMLGLAAEILSNRGKVLAVLDQTSLAMKLKAVTAGSAIWPKLLEGITYITRLAIARVPVKHRVRIVEARGRHQVEQVVVAAIDGSGRILQGTERIYLADTLAVGSGFSPNIELPQQAGCAVSYDTAKGGWYVKVNDHMETTVAEIYAVGETTGIAGGGKSWIEGRIAAWRILYKHGKYNEQEYLSHVRPLIRQRGRQLIYGGFLNHLCRLPPGCYLDIPDETVICRCEEITMSSIRKQLDNGFFTMNGIKKATRCGMGICQGRICGPILFDILSAYTHRGPDAIGCSSARAPVKAVPLGTLAEMKTGTDTHQGANLH